MAPTAVGKTNMPAMVYERICHMPETLTKQVVDSEEQFRFMDHSLAKLEASKHRYVYKFNIINVCSKVEKSQERQSINEWIQGENFQNNTMEIQVEVAGQGEFKEEVCKPEHLDSVVEIKVESVEIFHPMMRLVSYSLIESPFNKAGKSVTDQSPFLQLIDFIRLEREAEDESMFSR